GVGYLSGAGVLGTPLRRATVGATGTVVIGSALGAGIGLVVAEQVVESVLVQPGLVEGVASSAVGESQAGRDADVRPGDVGATLPRRMGGGGPRGHEVGPEPVDVEGRADLGDRQE